MNYAKIVRWGIVIKVGMFAAVCIASRVYSVDAKPTPEPVIAEASHCRCECDAKCCARDSEFKHVAEVEIE